MTSENIKTSDKKGSAPESQLNFSALERALHGHVDNELQ
jgi:hypothetical protein